MNTNKDCNPSVHSPAGRNFKYAATERRNETKRVRYAVLWTSLNTSLRRWNCSWSWSWCLTKKVRSAQEAQDGKGSSRVLKGLIERILGEFQQNVSDCFSLPCHLARAMRRETTRAKKIAWVLPFIRSDKLPIMSFIGSWLCLPLERKWVWTTRYSKQGISWYDI